MSARRLAATLCAATMGLLVGAGSARAQGNALSAPTGGRSTLMGNTGVALARDGSAPFLNPATIVRIEDHSLAFSVNFYTFTVTNFSGWHQPGPVDTTTFGNVALNGTSVDTSGFRVFPSTLCLFFTVRGLTTDEAEEASLHGGRHKLAVCFGSTEYDDVVLPALSATGTTSLGTTAQTQSIERSWNRFQAGPTYSIALTDDFAFGLSLHGVYTSESFVLDSSSITSGNGSTSIASSFGAGGSAHAFDLAAILGAAYRIGHVTLGASIQAPAVHLYGDYSGTLHQQYGVGGTDNAMLVSGSGNFDAPPPMRFSLGAGVEFRRLVLELDGTLVVPLAPISSSVTGSTTTLSGTSATAAPLSAYYTSPEHAAWNAGLGGEYFLSRSFSLIGGASTNVTTLPRLSPTMSVGNLVQSRASGALLSFGVGSYGGGSDLLVGAQLGYTWGETLAVNPYVLPNDFAVVDTHAYSVMLILAGATDLRSIKRAVEKVQNAVTTGNPDLPTPPPGQAPAQPGQRMPSSPADPKNRSFPPP